MNWLRVLPTLLQSTWMKDAREPGSPAGTVRPVTDEPQVGKQ